MKKRIVILFLSVLLVLVPCCSAFSLPINTDEINHLLEVINEVIEQSAYETNTI